mgnify:CR=1 FL=1
MLQLLRRAARFLIIACALAVAACSGSEDEAAAPRTEFNIGWSIYAGWMPWPYAEQAGIVKKWGDKYGITIKFVQVNDYIESVNQYTAGKLDGVTVANMDALTIPAAGGKDTSAIILGDYSNGNDAVLLKGADGELASSRRAAGERVFEILAEKPEPDEAEHATAAAVRGEVDLDAPLASWSPDSGVPADLAGRAIAGD